MEINPITSASNCTSINLPVNKYQSQIDNIPNMSKEEIDEILTNNRFYSGGIFDDGKYNYLELLRKKYAQINIEKVLSENILNNHTMVLDGKSIKIEKPCEDLEFIFDHQKGLAYFSLSELNDKIYFVLDYESDCIKIHANNPLDLLDFIKSHNLKINTKNKKEYINDLKKSMEEDKLYLEFLEKI